MTSKNLNLNKPFFLKPVGKDYLWGGRRLKDDFAKELPLDPLAETWECATHPDGTSTVASGEFSGMLLSDVIKEHPDFLGTHPKSRGELPILIKLIDADKDLSVQVHPDDAFANANENGQQGKTEMWYVLDAKPEAKLVYGLRTDLTEEAFLRAAENGTIGKYLQKIPVQKDDVFFVEAGTVHAIGAGVLIAEIQENSNLTYRLYDYDRVDRDGNKRALHIEKAVRAADLSASKEPKQPLRVLKYMPGMARELLCRCRYFEVDRMLINTERRQTVTFSSDETSFRVLLCVDGCGVISCDDATFPIYKGDTLFFPANSAVCRLHGQMRLLDVRG